MSGRIIILHYAAPPIVGGVESTIDHHARFLVEAGFEVEVVAGRGDQFHPKVKFHRIPELDSRHPQILEIFDSLSDGKIPEDFHKLRDQIAQVLRPILTGAQACIIHNAITLHKNLPLTAALHDLAGQNIVPLIAWCHDFAWQDELYTPGLHPGYPWDLLRTPWPGIQYVVVSEDRLGKLANLLDLPKEQIQVVTPGVDVHAFYKLESLTTRLIERLNLLEANPLMLLPARITRRKNIEFGIRVTAALLGQTPNPMLIITGPPGPHNPKNKIYLQELLALKEELKVDPNVKFLYQQGMNDQPLHISDAVISDFYRLADLLLFPSRREGFGIPVLEAGLARLPVFAADIPTVQESAGNHAFTFNPDGDPAETATMIAQHLENNSEYQLRQSVIRRFSWQNIIKTQLIPLIFPNSP